MTTRLDIGDYLKILTSYFDIFERPYYDPKYADLALRNLKKYVLTEGHLEQVIADYMFQERKFWRSDAA